MTYLNPLSTGLIRYAGKSSYATQADTPSVSSLSNYVTKLQTNSPLSVSYHDDGDDDSYNDDSPYAAQNGG